MSSTCQHQSLTSHTLEIAVEASKVLHSGDTIELDTEETEIFQFYLKSRHLNLVKLFAEQFGLTLRETNFGKLMIQVSSVDELHRLWQSYGDGRLRKAFLREMDKHDESQYHTKLRLSADQCSRVEKGLERTSDVANLPRSYESTIISPNQSSVHDINILTPSTLIATSTEAVTSPQSSASQSTTLHVNPSQCALSLSLDHQPSQTPAQAAQCSEQSPTPMNNQSKRDATESTYNCIELPLASGETVSNEMDAHVETEIVTEKSTLVSPESVDIRSQQGHAAETLEARSGRSGVQLQENSMTSAPIAAVEQYSQVGHNVLDPYASQSDKTLVETVQPGGNRVTSEQSNSQSDGVENLTSGSSSVETAQTFVIHRPPIQPSTQSRTTVPLGFPTSIRSHAVATASTHNGVVESLALRETVSNSSDAKDESVPQSAEKQSAHSHTGEVSASSSMERLSTEKQTEMSVTPISRDGEAQLSTSCVTSAPTATMEQPVRNDLTPHAVQSDKTHGEAVHPGVTSEQFDNSCDVIESSTSSPVSVAAPLAHPISTIAFTKFVLFTTAPVVKVWLRLENPSGRFDKFEMPQRPSCKQVWQTGSVPLCEKKKYNYVAKLQGSSGVLGFLKSTIGQNEEKFKENVYRVTRQLSVHRDVFEHPCDSNTTQGWKYFVAETIEGIETEPDLLRSLAEAALLNDMIQRQSSPQELAQYMIECVRMSTSKHLRAVYIVTSLSSIINSSSLGYSGINKNNAILLLQGLAKCRVFLQSHVSVSNLVDTLTALIAIAEDSTDFVPSWAGFVYWCFPMLPCREIVNRINDLHWGASYKPAVVSRTLQKLCSLIDDFEETEEILAACLNRLNSLSSHIEVFKALKRKSMPASRFDKLSGSLKIDLEGSVENQLAKYSTCPDLKALAALVVDLTELNDAIVPKMSQRFEMKTIHLLSNHGDVSQYGRELDTLVESPILFTEAANVECLMAACSKARHWSQNELFIKLASSAKLVHCLQPCAMVGLAENWLDAAKTLRTNSSKRSDLCQWYGYVSRILQVPCLALDHEAKSKLKEYFKSFFRGYTRDLLLSRVFEASDLCTILGLIGHIETEDADLLEVVCTDLEATIVKILQTVRVYDLEQMKVIKDLLLNGRLFVAADCANKILECMVKSQACDVHYAFLDVLSHDKLWKVISITDCDRLFVQWIETAIKVHSRTQSLTAGRSYIVYMYHYLGKMYSMDVLGNHLEIKVHAESRVKEVFAELDIGSAVDMLEAMSDFEQTAKELMEKHVGELKSGKLIPLRDLLCRLDRLGQMKQLNITDSCAYKRLSVLLEHTHIHLEQVDVELEQEQFIWQSCEFWRKIMEYKGCRRTELDRLECVQRMKQITEQLVQKLDMATITIHDYQCLLDFSRTKWDEIVKFMNCFPMRKGHGRDDFQEAWESLLLMRNSATQKVEPLDQLSSKFLVKLADIVVISDISSFDTELSNIKVKLSSSSATSIEQIMNPDFFSSLKHLIPPAQKLYDLRLSNSFFAVCVSFLTAAGIARGRPLTNSPSCEIPSVDCLDMHVAVAESAGKTQSITVSELVKFIANDCRNLFREWCEGVARNATLQHVTCYGHDYKVTVTDLRAAAKTFGLDIPNGILTALEWLKDLDENRKRIKQLKTVFCTFKVRLSETQVDKAMIQFAQCLSDPTSSTVLDMAAAMSGLGEILNEDTNDWWDTIGQLSSATDLVHFVDESKNDDFRNLIDAVEERSEQTIDESTVSDLIRVKVFLQPVLSRKSSGACPREFLSCIKKSLQKESAIISTCINNCRLHLHGLKALYRHVADRGELTKEIIAHALSKGLYVWTLEGQMHCNTSLKYILTKRQQGEETFRFNADKLNDLKSRALLLSSSDRGSTHSSKSDGGTRTSDKTGITKLIEFILVVNTVQEIAAVVTELHQLGHFSYRTFHHEISYTKNLQDNLNTLLEELRRQLRKWKSDLSDCRKKFESLNYLFSDQMFLMSSYLMRNLSEDASQKVGKLLYFIQPGIDIGNLQRFSRVSEKKDLSIVEKLEFLGNALDALRESAPCIRLTFLNHKELSAMGSVHTFVLPGQLSVILSDVNSTQTIPILLSLYMHTMGHFPLPSEVLFCYEHTSWEEVHLLLQRCVRVCKNSELHCIVNVERLSSEIQFLLVKELANISAESNSLVYRLAIICCGGSLHPIVEQFSSCVRHVQGFDAAALKACLQGHWTEVSMITSTVPGLGKTERIITEAANGSCKLKSVHISGPMSRHNLVRRLQSLAIDCCDILHLDIAEVDDPNLLDACLFEFILLGCLTGGTDIAYLPTKKIYIEVANTLQDRLRNALVMLSYFNRINLKWQNYSDYIVSLELHSPVQIVCHYLNQLDSGTLDVRDVKLTGPHRFDPLPVDICRQLLAKHFQTAEDISFAVVEIFLNVLASQLRKLTCSQFFTVKGLQAMLGADTNNDVRSRLAEALREIAKEFACRSVKSCRSVQRAAEATTKGQESGRVTAADLMAQRVEGMLQWADSNHMLIVFHSMDSHAVSPFYRHLSLVPPKIKVLFESQMRKKLPDFNELSRKELVTILERIACMQPERAVAPRVVADLTYTVTPDNLLKMILILMRIKANIPVVIMGETGCGKTSLIRYLAQTCETTFRHVNVHAGTTADTIVEEVESCSIQCRKLGNRQVWLFFDEINTSEHMGLLTDIICHHSCLGLALPRNLVLLAACNPYRLRENGQISTAGLSAKVRFDEFSKLVYRVHPLPETMIDYVWDYGTLSGRDERSYIQQMLGAVYAGLNFRASVPWPSVLAELLVASQDFIRNVVLDSMFVSLRDVHRCRTLMQFFVEMLETKRKFPSTADHTFVLHDDGDIRLYAVVLSLAHCYQSRLQTVHLRQDYWKKCSTVLYGSPDRYQDLMTIVTMEQMDLLNRMDIPPGIAKNIALYENVFVVLVCILNRIPVFLVGKPGCSKSLSVQLIKNSLRGKDSTDRYFQTLPNLFIVSYQGSESSTSDGIIKIFEKAEKYREINHHGDVLPVVLLDEVGLAEISKYNPLKVLHSLLEPQTGQLPNVAVVGISNWSLDAAKMNRAIHLSRPDMDVDNLLMTGHSISALSSPNGRPNTAVNKATLKALAESYYEYNLSQSIPNFHGLRDYYSAVKYISRLFNEQTEDSYDEIVQKGLLRNFGGLTVGQNDMIKLFLAAIKIKTSWTWSAEEIIKDNLKDRYARHLMLITSGGDTGLGILLKYNAFLPQKKVIIFGSKFEEDQTGDYSYRILSRVILCMEEGNILILKDLDSIYGSLYDMLNQNYTVVGFKKSCRIALGAYSNPMCQVHEKFRCVVLVDEDKVNYADPPFLNRFEKQLLRFRDVIDKCQEDLIIELQDWVEDFSTVDERPFQKEHAFVGINADTIPSLVYQLTKNGRRSSRDISMECKCALLWLVSPDAVLRLSCSRLSRTRATELESTQTLFFSRPVHAGLSLFVQEITSSGYDGDRPPSFIETHGSRVVVFTRSNIHVDLQRAFGKEQHVSVLRLGAIKSEKQLTKQLRDFFESTSKSLVLQCRPCEDGEHIPLVKFLLEELQQEYCTKDNVKHVLLVLHVDRFTTVPANAVWQFNYLSGWMLVTVDSVDDHRNFPLDWPHNESLGNIRPLLQQSINDLLTCEFRPVRQCILDNLVWAFAQISSSWGEKSVGELSELVQNIRSCDAMIDCLADAILGSIRSDDALSDESTDVRPVIPWQSKVACDMLLLASSTSFVDALKHYLTECVTTPLANIVHRLEGLSAWHSYFIDETSARLWRSMFADPLIFSLSDMVVPHGVGSFHVSRKALRLECPFSLCYIDKIFQLEDYFKHDFWSARSHESEADDLSEVSYTKIFEKYKNLFHEKVFSLLPDVLTSNKGSFIRDVCNCWSASFALDENGRIDILLWIQLFKSRRHTSYDALTEVTEMVLVIWQYEELCRSVLQLFAHCNSLLPCTAKEMLPAINFDDRKSSTDKSETKHSGVYPAERNVASAETEVGLDRLQPEEQLLNVLCRNLIPSRNVLDECGGVDGWHRRACSVLTFGSLVSTYPAGLHELRVFSDLAAVMVRGLVVESKRSAYLIQMAHIVRTNSEGESSLDSNEMLNAVCRVVDSLIEEECVDKEHAYAFLHLYMNRCIDLHPHTAVFGQQLLGYTQRDGKHMCGLGSLLHRCLLETDDLFDSFTYLIRTGDVERFVSNVHVAVIDGVLRRDGEMGNLFLQLCTDVLRRVVFRPFSWETLESVVSVDDVLLRTCKAAVGVLENIPHKISLQSAAAAAYVVEFFSRVAKFISDDYASGALSARHQLLYQVLNSVLCSCGNEFCNLLLRELVPGRTLNEVKRVLDALRSVVPSLERNILPDNDLALSVGRRILGRTSQLDEQLRSALERLEKDDSFVRNFLNDCREPAPFLTFLESLLPITYLSRCLRPMRDTEKQVGDWIAKNASDFAIFNTPLTKDLVNRLTGHVSFQVDILQLGLESGHSQVQQASVLVHLMCAVTSRRSEVGYKFFWRCLSQAIDDIDNLKYLRTLLYSQDDRHPAYATFADTCLICRKCWTCLCTSETLDRCPVCRQSLPSRHTENAEERWRVFIGLFQNRKRQIATSIVKFLLDSCILCSVGLGVMDQATVSAKYANDGEKPVDVSAVERTWSELRAVLHFTDEELSIMLHYVIDDMPEIGDLKLNSEDSMVRSIESVQTCIAQRILNSTLRRKMTSYRDEVSLYGAKLKQDLLLSPVSEATSGSIAGLLRSLRAASLQDVAVQLHLSGKQTVHGIIALFFEMAPALSLLRHLIPVLKWSLMSRDSISCNYSRNECKEMHVEKVLKTDKSDRHRECFEEFEKSWRELRSSSNVSVLTRFDPTLPSLPKLNQRVGVQMAVVEGKESVVYRVLRALLSIQNKFLDILLMTALIEDCPTLAFLKQSLANHCGTPHYTAVQSVLLQNAKPSQVIDFDESDLENSFLNFAQHELGFGPGDEVRYDFVRIEMELCNELVVGKTYLVLDDSFPTVVYSSELLVNSASILQDIKTQIPQRPISHGAIAEMRERSSSDPEYVQRMMKQTEVLLSLVRRTGSTTDQKIDSFVQTWQRTLPGEFSTHLLPSRGEPLHLSHVVALYECIESMHADNVIGTIADGLRSPVPDTSLREFAEFLEGSDISPSVMANTLKRFISRYLVNFDLDMIDLDQPLIHWMIQPSLWTDSDVECGKLCVGDLLRAISDKFPQTLNLDHAHGVLVYLEGLVAESTRETRWTTVIPKPITAARWSHAKRTRGKGKLGNT